MAKQPTDESAAAAHFRVGGNYRNPPYPQPLPLTNFPLLTIMAATMTVLNSPFKIKGLIKAKRNVQSRLVDWNSRAAPQAAQPGFTSPQVRKIYGDIALMAEQTAEELDRNHRHAGHLAIRSRRAFQWFSFLSKQDQFNQCLRVIEHLKRLHCQLTIPRRMAHLQPHFFLDHISPLYRIQPIKKKLNFVLQLSFLSAPEPVLLAILSSAYHPEKGSNSALIRNFTQGDRFHRIRTEIEYLGVPRQAFAQGKAFNLARIFNRVNQFYFNGEIDPPHLKWGDRVTHRKFGHYSYATDTVVISKSLDTETIPDYVLDYLMYHELLHKKVGFQSTGNRRLAHTTEFKEMEKEFPAYQEAVSYLENLGRRIKSGQDF